MVRVYRVPESAALGQAPRILCRIPEPPRFILWRLDGADTILGGTGRSLLIGGKGNNTVTGGSGDDVVIGGYTAYDSAWHEAALMDLLARWQSADSYATRVSTLGTTWHPLDFGTTVFDDGGTDKLTGGAGMDRFFTGSQDTITDYQGGEVVN